MKLLTTEQLNRATLDAIVRLSSKVPLYSINLADIANFINQKYELKGKERYLSGSIFAALKRLVQRYLLDADGATINKMDEISKFLKRGKHNTKPFMKFGRFRRVSFWIIFLAHQYVWKYLSTLDGIFKIAMPDGTRFRLICEEFFELGFNGKSDIDNEELEGIKEIFIVECTLPIGAKKRMPDISMRWIEPLNPRFIKFLLSLDAFILNLQERNIFDKNLSVNAIRQTFFGAIIWQVLGKILQERNNPAMSEQPEFYTADYSKEQALVVLKRVCSSFCANPSARQTFEKEWS